MCPRETGPSLIGGPPRRTRRLKIVYSPSESIREDNNYHPCVGHWFCTIIMFVDLFFQDTFSDSNIFSESYDRRQLCTDRRFRVVLVPMTCVL